MNDTTRRDLEHRFALAAKAATFDALVDALDEFVSALDEFGVTDRKDLMGGLDLPGLPAWGDGGDLARYGAWSWDATRVLYLDDNFHPRVEGRTDVVVDADVVELSGRLAAATCIMSFYTAEGASDASEALSAMMASDSWQGYGERGSASGREIRAELEREHWTMPENSDNQDLSLAWGDAVEALESRILGGEDNLGIASEVCARRAGKAI